MSFREDARLRAVATEAGRGDLVEAMDRADAELSKVGEQAREAYGQACAASRHYQELSQAQDHKVGDCKEIRRLIRVLAAAIEQGKS